MRYLPHTEAEIAEMLQRIGVSSIDDLFAPIPEDVRLSGPMALEPALDEAALMGHLTELAGKNSSANMLSFLGAGMYAHHIPPAVDQLLLRSEYYTAYTPYQAEYSQGTLQSIYEFQTIVCQLLGMEVANASMYDGASAAAEAVLMARRITRRDRVVVSAGLHPEYIATIRTYLSGLGGEESLSIAPLDAQGRTDLDALPGLLGDDVALLLVGYPNFMGVVESLQPLTDLAHGAGALIATATNEPYALSLCQSPGDAGVDIAVGEGQALAVPPQFGGPGVGLFACRKKNVHKMPGRLVGETVDAAGARGYTLTLSTREQHIRRERATSNICTNHGLIALAFGIRTAMLGRRGFREVGDLCLRRTEYLKSQIAALEGFELPYSGPTFNEVVVRSTARTAGEVLDKLNAQGILGGVPVSRFDSENQQDWLLAVTERHSRADLDRLIGALAEI